MSAVNGVTLHLTCDRCDGQVAVPVGFKSTVIWHGDTAEFRVNSGVSLHTCPKGGGTDG